MSLSQNVAFTKNAKAVCQKCLRKELQSIQAILRDSTREGHECQCKLLWGISILTGRPPVSLHFLQHMTESSFTCLVSSLHYALHKLLTSIKAYNSVV